MFKSELPARKFHGGPRRAVLRELPLTRGLRGKRLRALPYGGRLAIKVVAYVVLIEAAFLIGEAIFDPEAAIGLFTSLNGGR